MPPKRGVLFAADTVLVFFILTPLHIIYWRGTWDVWDHYLQIDCKGNHSTDVNGTGIKTSHSRDAQFTESEECKEFTGNWISAGVGCLGCIVLNCVSPLMERGAKRLNKASYIATSRFYMYLFSFSCFGQWRGVWNLLDVYTDTGWDSNLRALGPALALTLLLRTLRHSIPQPWTNSCDEDGDRFRGGGWLQLAVGRF